MHTFLLKELYNSDLETELCEIGFDKSYIHKAVEKFGYKNIKIYNLTCTQSNILKQTALTVGADCATHREVITGKIENSNVILGGSLSQLKKIAEKLKLQPFHLKNLGEDIEKILVPKVSKTQIVGILNITKDSFSDGGTYYDYDDSIKHLNELIEDGADIIDIGAESTRPGAAEIDEKTQLDKLIPVLNYINKNNIKIPISIDTRNSNVAKICIKNGANIINDVSGFDFDNKMAEIISQNPNTKVIIQHSKGTPETMQNNPNYENTVDEIYFSLNKKIETAINFGIKKENIITDPGIGFGKTREDNFKIIKHWKEFKTLGCPVMIGLSRKSLLGIPEKSNEEKDMYSLALSTPLIYENIDFLRVHNVKIYKKFMDILPNSY